jgi:hypothetical protein
VERHRQHYKFAGNDLETARYYEEDKKYLLELEENVNHYETYYS